MTIEKTFIEIFFLITKVIHIHCRTFGKYQRAESKKQPQPTPVFLPGKSHGQMSLVN